MKKVFLIFGFMLVLLTFTISNYSVTSYASLDVNSYTAKSLFLMDYDSGQVLFEKNSLEKLPVASIVKLMTIYLTCEQIESGKLRLDEPVSISENASGMGGSQVFIESNTEYSVEDLLKSTIVSSANDASVALAEKIAGSEGDFVTLMNKKAMELGLNNTNYVNCTGLPASNQYSCASDVAKLLKNVTKFKTYHNYSKIWIDTLKHPNNRETELVNTNKLIRYFEGCDGGKTGSTSEAGYCLSATAKRGNMRLIAVVLGAKTGKLRFAETSKLLSYGFANFENKLIIDSSKCLNEQVAIKSGKKESIPVIPEKNFYIVTSKHDNSEVSVQVKLNSVKAPVKKGDKVGIIYITKEGVVIESINILANENVDKAKMLDDLNTIVNNWAII